MREKIVVWLLGVATLLSGCNGTVSGPTAEQVPLDNLSLVCPPGKNSHSIEDDVWIGGDGNFYTFVDQKLMKSPDRAAWKSTEGNIYALPPKYEYKFGYVFCEKCGGAPPEYDVLQVFKKDSNGEWVDVDEWMGSDGRIYSSGTANSIWVSYPTEMQSRVASYIEEKKERYNFPCDL